MSLVHSISTLQHIYEKKNLYTEYMKRELHRTYQSMRQYWTLQCKQNQGYTALITSNKRPLLIDILLDMSYFRLSIKLWEEGGGGVLQCKEVFLICYPGQSLRNGCTRMSAMYYQYSKD